MKNKTYDDIKDIIDHDAEEMDDEMRIAWFGYLSALVNELQISIEQYQELADKLKLSDKLREKLYDVLSGGITERE